MEYLRRLVIEFTRSFTKTPTHENVLEVSRLDAYFNTIYKVMLWENPTLTWIVLAILHVLFWIIVQFHFRLYGIVFLTILTGLIVDLYFERIGLQAVRNENSDTIRDTFNILFNGVLYLKALRKDNPPIFCGLMCTIFLVLSILSKNVPGYFVTYIILMLIFFGPLAISKLPNEYKNKIVNTIQLLNINQGVLAETELIPFISNNEMNEKDPELESLLTDRTADSITSSLINGINSMPSYLEAEGSLDGLEEEDLVPNAKNNVYCQENNSSDSDSDHRNIKLDSIHFNGDSSSDEEKHYADGLRFADIHEASNSPAKSYAQETLTLKLGLLGSLTAVGTTIMSNVTSSTNIEKPKRKDSDSDFEIINPDDAAE